MYRYYPYLIYITQLTLDTAVAGWCEQNQKIQTQGGGSELGNILVLKDQRDNLRSLRLPRRLHTVLFTSTQKLWKESPILGFWK